MDFKFPQEKNTAPEIRSIFQTGEDTIIGLSLEETNVFWVDYRGNERLNRSGQVILLSRWLTINKRVKWVLFDSYTKIVNL